MAQALDARHAHIDRECRAGCRERSPVGFAMILLVRCNEGDALAMLAMRKRYPKTCSRRKARRNAVDDFHWNLCAPQCREFFSRASEQQGIAAFYADHMQALERIALHQPLNERLRCRLAAAALADANHACPRRKRHDLGISEIVQQHDIRSRQCFGGFDREQVQIPGTGAKQGDLASCHRDVLWRPDKNATAAMSLIRNGSRGLCIARDDADAKTASARALARGDAVS